MDGSNSNALATAALIIAIAVPLISLVVSVAVTVCLHRQAIARADEANVIAGEALHIERTRLRQEEQAFVRPSRFDPLKDQAVFEVIGRLPLDNVEFEFRKYDGSGGIFRKSMVQPGETRIRSNEFEDGGQIKTPAPKQFLALARWRTTNQESWEESGVYTAVKGKLQFRLSHEA